MAKSKTHPVEVRANEILEKVGIMSNAYFQALESGQLSKEAFAASQEQFYFAVSFYSRPMGILIARLPDSEKRMDILHNMVDEHGDFDNEKSHQSTFQRFLRSLGRKVDRHTPVSPAVHSFNSVLTSVCAFEEIEIGICCLGVIELAFAEISAKIGKATVERGFVSAEDLVHYTLHAELDAKHADDFFTLVHQQWKRPTRRVHIEKGLELGAFIFDRLYSELFLYGLQKAGEGPSLSHV